MNTGEKLLALIAEHAALKESGAWGDTYKDSEAQGRTAADIGDEFVVTLRTAMQEATTS